MARCRSGGYMVMAYPLPKKQLNGQPAPPSIPYAEPDGLSSWWASLPEHHRFGYGRQRIGYEKGQIVTPATQWCLACRTSDCAARG